MEAHGPNTAAASPNPMAWPLVPPGSGTLNIITTNEKAENKESNGTNRVCNSWETLRKATIQNGVDAAYMLAQVDGLR